MRMAAIVGGGLSGLATGYYLLRNNFNFGMKVFLLEAADSCGGWIRSIKTPDYLFEQGPRTIRPKGVNGLHTLNMIAELGLGEHISPIPRDHPAAKNRMICVNNELHTLPTSLKSIFFTNKPFTKPLIYALLNDLKQPQESLRDDSIYNFVHRRFGKEIADYAISPMICGICAGDAKEISVKFLLKSLFEWEQTHGGVLRGMVSNMFQRKSDDSYLPLSELAVRSQEEKWNVYSIKGGLQVLPTALKDHLIDNNVSVMFNSAMDDIEFVDSGTVYLKGNLGPDITEMTVNHVYSAIPAYKLAKLMERQHPELSQNLAQIPFVDVGLVNLYYEKNYLSEPAFGFLVPPIENSKILGVVFDSCCLPDQNGTVLTVMIGGKWFNERLGENPSKDTILDIALNEVKTVLKIAAAPAAHHVSILHKCIPQYVVGHHDRVDRIRRYIVQHNLPLSVVGCSYDGVGINDVIASAKSEVESCFS